MPSFLVCSPVGYFGDDVQATCATCGAAIVHRPHAPADMVKLCLACAGDVVTSSPEPPVVRVTEKTLREILLYNAKTDGTQ